MQKIIAFISIESSEFLFIELTHEINTQIKITPQNYPSNHCYSSLQGYDDFEHCKLA